MYSDLNEKVIEKRLGYLSIATGLQFLALAILYVSIAASEGFQIKFAREPPISIMVLVGLVFMIDWLVNLLALPALAIKSDKKRLLVAIVAIFLALSFLSRLIAIFSLAVVQFFLDFLLIYTVAPMASMLFSVFIFLVSMEPIAYSRGKRLRLLSAINFFVSAIMFIFGFINYNIVPVPLDWWNFVVFLYSYKVGILPLFFAFEYDSWASEIKTFSKLLDESN